MVCFGKIYGEVNEMGRQIPKNVRQIGNVSDNSKIYIEDYVDIFLNQLSEKSAEKISGAFLVGETVEEGEVDYIYIHGALAMQNPVVKGKDLIIEEAEWKYVCETSKEYFGDAEILGWVMIGGDQPFEMTHSMQKMHQKYFQREKSVFLFKSLREKEEKLFMYKLRDMIEVKGYYIFYEKNVEMQEYMIATRKQAGISPSESLDDQAAKSFRSIIQEKMEQKEEKSRFKVGRFMKVASLLVLLMAGVVLQNRLADREVPVEEQEVVSNEPIVLEPEVIVLPEIEEEVLEEVEKEEQVKEEVEETAGIQMEEVYVVQKGDTIASISTKVYGDIARIGEICELNGLGDGNLIFIGQKLLLP